MKTTFFDKLNLRPQERRLVVIVSLVVFAVGMYFLILYVIAVLQAAWASLFPKV